MSDEKPAPLALLPVYLYEHDFELPEDESYYLVARDGIYLHRQTEAGDAFVKVKGIPWLQNPDISFKLKLPKIPARIIGQALTFFRKVFEKHNSEAYVTLLYSNKLNTFRLWCPVQTVSKGSVNYDRTDRPSFQEQSEDEWQMVGTIHSHCDFSAFHSGTDTFDESTFDGIHVTLGHVNRQQISIASSIAINDQREQIEPENCCEGVFRTSDKKTVTSKWMNWNQSYYFDLQLSEEDIQGLVADAEVIENEWMPKVTKEVYTYQKKSGTGNANLALGGIDDAYYEDHYDDLIDRDNPGNGKSIPWWGY